MKKLLSILAATGLIATSTTTVVACGKGNKKDTPESEIDRTSIIEKFKERVRQEITKHLKLIGSSLTRLNTDVSNDQFLSMSSLKGLKQGLVDLNPTQKSKLANEFHSLMKIDDIAKKINDLVKEEEYSLILSGLPNDKPFGQMFIPDKIIFIKDETTENDFVANVIFTYEFKIYYEESPSEVVPLDGLKEEFQYLLTSNEKFYRGIEKMHKDIQENIITKGVNFEDLEKYTKKTKLENMTKDIETFYNREKEALRENSELLEDIENNFFNDVSDMKLNFSSEGDIVEINEEDWIYKYRSKGNDEKYNRYIADEMGAFIGLYTQDENGFVVPEQKEAALKSKTRQILKLIYRESLVANEDASIQKISKMLLDSKMPSNDESEYDNLEKAFYNKINTKFNSKQFEKIGDNSRNRITQIGTMSVKNLQVKFGNSGNHYTIPGPFSMYVSYLPIQEKGNIGDRTHKVFKEEIAKNIINGILGFRDVYNIVGYPEKDGQSVMQVVRNGELYKLWGEWENETDLESINAQINLETPKLEKYKTDLYKKSKQSHFYYTFVGFGKDKIYNIETLGDSIYLNHPKNTKSIYNFQLEMDYFRIQIEYDIINNDGISINLMKKI